MPHIEISMFSGRTEEQKKAAAEAVIKAMMETLGCERSHLSVAIHDYDKSEWNEKLRPTVDESAIIAGELFEVK